MRDEIRGKTTTKIDDETKESLILEGKNKAIEEFQNMFATGRVLPWERQVTVMQV